MYLHQSTLCRLQESRSYNFIWELCPKVRLEACVSLLAHGTLNQGLDDYVGALEDAIVEVVARFKVGDLCVNIERVNEEKIHLVIRESIITLSTPGEIGKMRAALDSEPFGIETNVLKLVKIDKANELFVRI